MFPSNPFSDHLKNAKVLNGASTVFGSVAEVLKLRLMITLLCTGFLSLSFESSLYAQCNLINESFDANPVLSSTNVAGAWYPDRYRPAGFAKDVFMGENVLKISIDGIADGAANRPGGQQGSFYNTQGRKFNQCGKCVTLIRGDLYIPSSWATAHRRSDLWATAYNASNAVSFYPIIGFRNVDGATPRLYCWNGTTSQDLSAPAAYDTWYTFEARLSGANIEYLINNVVVASFSHNSSVYFSDVILQAYNFNDPAIPAPYTQSTDSYDAYWDNLYTSGIMGGNVVVNTTTNEYFCSLQDAINDAQTLTGHTLMLEGDLTEGIVSLNKALTIDGNGKTLTSTSALYGIDISVAGATIKDLTVDRSVLHGGTYGIFANCGANNLYIENTTVQNGGASGFAINGCDNVTLKNITATNNVGNGVSITNCDNLIIDGITTSLNAFSPAFSAGIGLFTSNVYCLPAGINGFTLTGTVNIGEPVKVYGEKTNASEVITGLNGASISWAVGTSAVNLSYWPDKLTAYAVVDALFDVYSFPNTNIYVQELATGNMYVDDNPTGDATPPMSVQAGVNYAPAGKKVYLEEGTFNQKVVIDRSISLEGVTSDETKHVLNGTGLGVTSGIFIANNITNVSIKNLTVQNFTGASGNANAGIYANLSNNDLVIDNVAMLSNTSASGFYANGPINNVSITNSTATSNGSGARGIVFWNGLKTNINITGNTVSNNNCCGIELQDGNASDVDISSNILDIGAGDNAIGVVGLNLSAGANTINNNTITGGGRYGIEIKNPAGGVTVNGNMITLNTQNSDVRDRAGIAILRRGVTSGNVDVPNGVTITNNMVSGYQQSSTSEGFGIVVEGTNHTVTGNTVSSCDVGILQQQNPSNYPGDADQSNLSDLYFGRGNSPMTCGNTINSNTFSGNSLDTRNIGVGYGIVTNINTNEFFCSIQSAINDAQTLTGHVLEVSSNIYNEQVLVTKGVTIRGVGATQPVVDFTGTVVGKPTLFDVSADGVTIENIHFNVDLAKLSSAVIISGAAIDNIAIKSNIIDAYGTPALPYGNRNAISINYGGTTNYRVATGGVDNILCQNNTVNGTAPSGFVA